EIKRAFRRRARELHPDVNKDDPQAEEKFKQLAEAYEVLSDPERRAIYDRYGWAGLERQGFQPTAHSYRSFSDIFEAFFGGGGPFGYGRGGGRQAGPPRGMDLEVVRRHILEVGGVEDVHDLHAWTISSGLPVVSAHVVLRDGAEPALVLDELCRCLSTDFDVEHSTFQLETHDRRRYEEGHHA
ncbi:MAG TPA: DnaJ domain-containing protein, partial [Candidatus Limnocylindrales bacterium]|nr:DnaJ domain-containing protein [Candidatus Limnocylindrales bacterium]